MEKRPRQYQSDAAVHQAYMQATTGGGELGDGADAGEAEPAGEGPKAAKNFFEPLPWNITGPDDMNKILDFGHRLRLTAFAKELLQLPCMHAGALDELGPNADDVLARAETWRGKYARVAAAEESEHIELIGLQAARLQANYDDAALDVGMVDEAETQTYTADAPVRRTAPPACFSRQEVYRTPSAYIAALIAELPSKERLSRATRRCSWPASQSAATKHGRTKRSLLPSGACTTSCSSGRVAQGRRMWYRTLFSKSWSSCGPQTPKQSRR